MYAMLSLRLNMPIRFTMAWAGHLGTLRLASDQQIELQRHPDFSYSSHCSLAPSQPMDSVHSCGNGRKLAGFRARQMGWFAGGG